MSVAPIAIVREPRETLETRWHFRDQVIVDGDDSIIGIVTAFQFREGRLPVVAISYFFAGDAKEVWIEEWRLTAA